MATTLKPLAQTTLTVTPTTYYTVPASTTTVIKTITVCNPEATSQTFSIWLVASADSEAAKNRLVKDISLTANETVFINPDHYLTAGYKLMAAGSAVTLGMTVSGVEVV